MIGIPTLSIASKLPEQALLRRLVVIRRHDERGIRTGLFCVLCQFNRFGSRIGPRPGDHGHAFISHLDADFHDTFVFVMAERRRLAGRTDRHEAVRTLVDLPVDQISERFFIHVAVAERA